MPAGILLPGDAQDTVSSVAWSPTAPQLAVASWDRRLRVYDVKPNNAATTNDNYLASVDGVALLAADGPLLSCDWAQDGTTVVAAGADGANYLLHVPTGTVARAGGHAGPVRAVRFVDVPGTAPGAVYASGSWDGTVRYWDVRRAATAGPLATLTCTDRVYALDARDGLLVVATAATAAAAPAAGKLSPPPIQLVDLRRPADVLRTAASPLAHQTRDVAVRPGGRGWATASIEGRVGVNAVEETNSSNSDNYTFRCHRTAPAADAGVKTSLVYAVNTVRFHPVHPTTAVTGGSDGALHFWDIAARCRLSTYGRDALWAGPPAPAATAAAAAHGAITTAAFSHDGRMLAFAVGYDWSRGHRANAPDAPNKLMVLPVTDKDAKPRKR